MQYLVQYADNNGMVMQWANAPSHLEEAADVLIDMGFDNMKYINDDTMIIVVCRTTYVAGNYSRGEVRQYANRILGLTPHDGSDGNADWWKE